jgi:hypothetical protein
VKSNTATSFSNTPASLVDYAIEEMPVLTQYGTAERFNLMRLVYSNASVSKRNQHVNDPDCFIIEARTLEKLLGRDYMNMFDETGLIESKDNYHFNLGGKGYTKQRKVSDKGKDLVNKYHDTHTGKTEFLDANMKPTRSPGKNAIKSRDSKNSNAKCKGNIAAMVKVNVTALEALRDALNAHKDRILYNTQPITPTGDTDELEKWLGRRIMDVSTLIFQATSNVKFETGFIPLKYTESPTGRIYGDGFHLQNIPREIRHAALKGQYDYDLKNCHYSIFSQLAKSYNMETPHVDHYLANKKEIRVELSELLNVPVEKIKECLLALIYGASVKIEEGNAITHELGADKATLFVNDARCAGIAADIKRLKPVIIKAHKLDGKLINALNKTCDKETDELAHILQGIEAKMLNIAIGLFGESITLLQHDGFTSPDNSLDIELFKREIFNATGFNMGVSKDIITVG